MAKPKVREYLPMDLECEEVKDSKDNSEMDSNMDLELIFIPMEEHLLANTGYLKLFFVVLYIFWAITSKVFTHFS